MTIGNPNDVDRIEKVKVSRHGSSEYVEHVVEDAAAAQRSFTYQFTGLLWLLIGALEGLLALRLILKLMAANPSNAFARLNIWSVGPVPLAFCRPDSHSICNGDRR